MYAVVNHLQFLGSADDVLDLMREGAGILSTYPGFHSLHIAKEGKDRLRRNHDVVASFSRGLVEGLSARQSDAEFNALLDAAIQSIFEASTVKQESKTRTSA